MIHLAKDTITQQELAALAEWLKRNPRLTKGELTVTFEQEWAKWLGTKYAVFTNSGSSANLLMFDALINSKRLKSRNIVAPAVSWVTTVAPIIQLGLNPILCDADPANLGLNLNNFEDLLKKNEVSAAIVVHVLGVPNHMEEILSLCRKYNVILLEDCCESPGSLYDGKKVGTFGEMSSFSFYYGHHISTIEGGMVCVNDEELLSIVLSIRSHGWSRDLPANTRAQLEEKYSIEPFESLYTFYYAGYNFRPTEINAFLGLSQLKKIDFVAQKRNRNYLQYLGHLKNQLSCQENDRAFISNFAFGVISNRRKQIVDSLRKNEIECRPLICGSIGQQPFWRDLKGVTSLPIADKVHRYGMYFPNNQDLTDHEIEVICEAISEAVSDQSSRD